MKNNVTEEDILLRDLMISSAVDVSKIDHGAPYPLIWDKDFNFIGHKCFEDVDISFQPERLNPKTSQEDVIVRTSDESGRDKPEAVCPPGDRS